MSALVCSLSRWRERAGVRVERPLAPHPDPLPASGERGKRLAEAA